MRKILVYFLAALVLITVLAIPALAADGSVAVSPATGKSGEVITLTISLSDFEQASSIGVSISSDMTLVGGNWTLTGGMIAHVLPANNAAAWQANIGQSSVVNGKVLELQFQIPQYTGVTSYSATVTVEVKNGNNVLGTSIATGTVTVKNPAESVTLNKNTLTLDLSGTKTATLTAVAAPDHTTDTVTWSSSDSSVASVVNGTVTGLKLGTATVTATAGAKSANCVVTVTCSHTNAVKTTANGPTCQNTGNNAYWTCADCGNILKEDKATVTTVAAETLAIVDHNGGTATCTAKAICSMCNNPYGSTKPHSFSTAWQKDSTNHWHICTTCNTEKDSFAAHSFSWRVDSPASDISTGLKHEECDCGQKRNEGTLIPLQDHVHGSIQHHTAVKATCIKTGTLEYWTCGKTKCAGKYYADANCQIPLSTIIQPVDAKNHAGKFEVRSAVSATCSKEGYSGDTWCLACKTMSKKGAVVPATGKHTPKANYLKDANEHWQECSVCNALIGKKTSHTFAWVTDQKATEQATGIQHEECSTCKSVRSENTVIDKLPHIPAKVEAKDATCTEEGALEHYYCPNCDGYFASVAGEIGEAIEKDTVISPALGHSYDEKWLSDAKGHWHVCGSCSTASEAEAHVTEIVGAVEATKESEGYTGDTICTICDAEISKGQIIPVITEEPTTDPQPEQNNTIVAVAIGAVVILGLGGGAVLLIKKKPWQK